MKIPTHTIIQKKRQTPIIHIFTQYNHTYTDLYAPALQWHKKKCIALFKILVTTFRKIYQGYIPCIAVTPHPAPHPVVRKMHPQTHVVTGNLRVPRHQNVNILFCSVLLIRCWSMMDLQKFQNSRMGRYLIYLLWIS